MAKGQGEQISAQVLVVLRLWFQRFSYSKSKLISAASLCNPSQTMHMGGLPNFGNLGVFFRSCFHTDFMMVLRAAPIAYRCCEDRPSKPPISNSRAAHQHDLPHVYIFGYICETALEKFWVQSCFDAWVVLHCFSLTAHGLTSQHVRFEVAV